MSKRDSSITPVAFDSYETTLETGVNFIEASAGTGKTFSIVMLVLRFVLQEGYTLEQLLVVTFTNAAAQELRDRIRSRLIQVKTILAGQSSDESDLNRWVADFPDEQLASQRIMDALADIDNASIFTIHGFCQRTLSQYTLESGQIFGFELIDNVSQIKQSIAEDYWRIQTYSRSSDQAALLRSIFSTPEQLLASIKGIPHGSEVIPETILLDACLDTLERQLVTLRNEMEVVLDNLQVAIEHQPDKFKPAFLGQFEQLKRQLTEWIDNAGSVPLTMLLKLSSAAFKKDALNGNKFRKSNDISSEERKEAFLLEQCIVLTEVDRLEENLPNLSIAFRQGLHTYLQVEIETRLAQANQLSFDGIISHLFDALKGDHAAFLKQLLQEKYPVALIDEFQDTDDAQWFIFSSLAESAHHYLYLIGDPKQAIYKFRGADIYSYLSAKKQAQREYNLVTNWRSQKPLVDAVNTLFADKRSFLMQQIAYYPVQAALDNSRLRHVDHAYERLVLWELGENPEQKDGYWLTTKGKPKEHIRLHVIAETLALLNNKSGIKLGEQSLCPADIAILVRSNTEAAAYQQGLSAYGIPAVLNSKTSVFISAQAHEIYHLLHAILRPDNQQLLRYALCQPWFGLDGNDIHDLMNQPQLMDEWLIRFQLYHELWERKGLLAMLHTLMEQQEVVRHLAMRPEVERSLTNINHILELLQEAALTDRLSMHKTLEWLENALQEKTLPSGQELRLESDENAVDIVTIHGSKGLEYPIVFCPDLWARNRARKNDTVVFHAKNRQISDLGSSKIEEHRELMDQQDLAEELRLLYVALTRAQYRCYVAWADQRTLKQENNSALAHLLKQQPGDTWTERITALSGKTALSEKKALSGQKAATNYIEHQTLEVDKEITDYFEQSTPASPLVNRTLQRNIQSDWIMSSYSGLANFTRHDVDIPELPMDKSEQFEANISSDSTADEKETLPKGPHTGNLVHELLEHTPFTLLANELDNADYVHNRTEMIQRFAVDIENTRLLDTLLKNTVTTALSAHDEQFILAGLADRQCLKEMPFYFKVKQLKTNNINRILKNSASYLPLTTHQMQGQLTGFIDLICEYQGRYYVMDYKTNSLPEYSLLSMTQCMREHNYGLQYWIYTLVLHRYLQQTLTGYSFDKHFGGVRYLFVRGMNPAEPMSGVFQDQPDLATLEALSRVFSE